MTANQGFINQFGTKHDANGNLALDANHVGAWNGVSDPPHTRFSALTIQVNFGSQVLLQGLSPITAQKFGLKFNLYALTVFILIVSIPVTRFSANVRPLFSRL